MADKKLNEVPVVSDIVTIFGKRSNGEIVQIDKSNLATLPGELIGVANAEKNGLMSKNGFIDRVHVNGTSFDDDIASGIYLVNGATSADLNAPFGYGILAVFSSNGFVSQFAMQFGKDASSIRYRNFDRSVGVWNKWAVLNTIIG